MADIQIERKHDMGLLKARKVAAQWVEQAEEKFDMACTYDEGESEDLVSFSRSGVSGTLAVTADTLVLNARLGFLLSAFSEKIEGEIVKNLDALLAQNSAAGHDLNGAAGKRSAG
jgi:putative polyhydroxyalkanoate system protein